MRPVHILPVGDLPILAEHIGPVVPSLAAGRSVFDTIGLVPLDDDGQDMVAEHVTGFVPGDYSV